MDIDQNELRELIVRVLAELESQLKGNDRYSQAVPKPKKQAYVVCEKGREEALRSFLSTYADVDYEFTVALENSDNSLISSLTGNGLCKKVVSDPSQIDESITVSFYPALSRSALAEAAMCMDTNFSARWIRKDFEEGRKAVVFSSGIEPFTGKEPKLYQKKVLSYIRDLMMMEVCVKEDLCAYIASEDSGATGGSDAPEQQAEEKPAPAAPARYDINTSGNLLLAKEIESVPSGSTIKLNGKKVISPMARDIIRERNITVING